MNEFQIFFAVLAVIIFLAGFVPYIYHVFHGRVVPHAFSWSVGAILISINTYVLISSQGWSLANVAPIIRIIWVIIGAIIWWIYISRIRISWFDYLCISLALVCIAIVYKYGAMNAVIPTIIVDILVLLPTVKKIWDNPDTEDAWIWVCGVFSALCIVLSLSVLTREILLFWGYAIIVNTVMALLIYRRKIVVHRWGYIFDSISRRLYARCKSIYRKSI